MGGLIVTSYILFALQCYKHRQENDASVLRQQRSIDHELKRNNDCIIAELKRHLGGNMRCFSLFSRFEYY